MYIYALYNTKMIQISRPFFYGHFSLLSAQKWPFFQHYQLLEEGELFQIISRVDENVHKYISINCIQHKGIFLVYMFLGTNPPPPTQNGEIELRHYSCSILDRGKRKYIMRFEIRYFLLEIGLSPWGLTQPQEKKYLILNLIISFHFLTEWWRTHSRTGLMSGHSAPQMT